MRPWSAAILAAVVLPACHAVRKSEAAAANVLLPPAQEKELGQQLQPQIEQQFQLLNDPQVVGYVNRVGQRVATTIPNPDRWQFQFKIIDDPKTANAFAIPGGTIYVYTGLLTNMTDEAQLAGVLGHEEGHVVKRHIAQRMVGQYGLQTLASVALGQNPGALAQLATSIAVNGALLKNSRDDEDQADEVGTVAASQAGYDPHGIVEFFEHLKQQEQGAQVPAFFSSHPTSEARIQAILNLIQTENLTGTARNQAEFQQVRSQLR